MMFGDNQVTVDHKKDGWYISFKYTDKRIIKLLEYTDIAIFNAREIENKYNNGDGKIKKPSIPIGVRM